MTVTFGGAKVSSLSRTAIPRRHEKIVTAWPWAVKPLARSRRWELTPPSQYGGNMDETSRTRLLSTFSRPLDGPQVVLPVPPERSKPMAGRVCQTACEGRPHQSVLDPRRLRHEGEAVPRERRSKGDALTGRERGDVELRGGLKHKS